ncbi:MAG: DsbC family protein [Brachymonas sp.]|jgi:thiol:disulfide interchange protein DsbC
MKIRTLVLALGAVGVTAAVIAQQVNRTPVPVSASDLKGVEATIRKNLPARLNNFPAIDEVRPAPMAGLYEVRLGGDVVYTDASADYLFQGEIVDVKAHRNLTKERQDKLAEVDFKLLPIKDALTIVRGNGKRKMAVFEDPNCGYCKRFESDLKTITNVTVHIFLTPILGEDSVDKSRNIWCSKDRGATWQAWMIDHKPPAQAAAGCDTSALDRNVAFAQKYRINGTPAVFFTDGTRVPGAMPAQKIEAMLSKAP